MPLTVYTIYRPVFKLWRARRFRLFCETFGLSSETAAVGGARILDVGGWPGNWTGRPRVAAHIDTLNLTAPNYDPAKHPDRSIGVLVGDGCAMGFADGAYDIAYSNSVIEHLGTWDRQRRFAAELQRVGRGVWCQTPAFGCPIEPHYMVFFIHWLPKRVQRRLLRHFTPMGLISKFTPEKADRWIAETRLLSKREMRDLFPACRIRTEWLIPGLIPKSHIAWRVGGAACDFAKAGYRVLRRDGRPLLLVPPTPAAAALTLGLYLPQTAKARVAVSALRLANRLRLLRRVLPSVPPSAAETLPSDSAQPFTQVDLDAGRIGVLLCNPSHGGGRFIAIRAGDVPSIVKGAARPQAASLEQERAILGRLAALGLPGVPSVLSDGGDATSYWFEMPHYARAEVKSVADIRAIRLLESWTGGETVNPLEAEPLRSIVTAQGAQALGSGELERLSMLRIRRAAMHGDFAPWNLRKGAEGLVAIDWEWGRRDGLAGLDLGYGLLQEALLVKKLPPPAALQFARRLAATLPCAAYLKQAGWGGALDLWLSVCARYRAGCERRG